jgi:hypothetical protein
VVRKGTWNVVFGRKDQSLISFETHYTCDEILKKESEGGEERGLTSG